MISNSLPWTPDEAQRLLAAGAISPDQMSQFMATQQPSDQGQQASQAELDRPPAAPQVAPVKHDMAQLLSDLNSGKLTQDEFRQQASEQGASEHQASQAPAISPVTAQARGGPGAGSIPGSSVVAPPSLDRTGVGTRVPGTTNIPGSSGGQPAARPGTSANATLLGTETQFTEEEKAALRAEQAAVVAKAQNEADVRRYTSQATQGAVDAAEAQRTRDDQRLLQANAAADAETKQLQAQSQKVGATKIDPDRYFKNKSEGSRFIAGLGLLFGAGGGAGGNKAADVMQKAIDRDVDGQKTDLENAHKSIQEQMGLSNDKFTRNLQLDEHAARSRIQGYTMAKDAIITKAAELGSPGAMADAQRVVAQLDGVIASTTKELGLTKYQIAHATEQAQAAAAAQAHREQREDLLSETQHIRTKELENLRSGNKILEGQNKPPSANQQSTNEAHAKLVKVTQELIDLNKKRGQGVLNREDRARGQELWAEAQKLLPLAQGVHRAPSPVEEQLSAQQLPGSLSQGLLGRAGQVITGGVFGANPDQDAAKLDQLQKSLRSGPPTAEDSTNPADHLSE